MSQFVVLTNEVTLPTIPTTTKSTDGVPPISKQHNSDPLLMEFNLENSYSKIFNIPHNNDVVLSQPPFQNPPYEFRKQIIQQIQELTQFWKHLTTEKHYSQVQFFFFRSAMSNTVYKVSLNETSSSLVSSNNEPQSFIVRIYGTGLDASYSSILKSYKEHEQQTHTRKEGNLSRNTSNQSIKSIASETFECEVSTTPPLSPFSEVSSKIYLSPYLGHSLESLWMCLLSEEQISPCVYGQFGNGRIEETILDSFPLSADTIRHPSISNEVAKQLGILHSSTDSLRKLAVKLYRECNIPYRQLNEIMNRDLHYWKIIQTSFHKIQHRLSIYPSFQYSSLIPLLSKIEGELSNIQQHRHVFVHSDLQYGNIMCNSLCEEQLALNSPTVILIDYEYGSFGPRAFDIANHFFEWMCNYHTDTPEKIHPQCYPTEEEMYSFLSCYLMAVLTSLEDHHRRESWNETAKPSTSSISTSSTSIETPSHFSFYSSANTKQEQRQAKIDRFLRQYWKDILLELQFFTLISDLKWSFWGIEQHVMRTKDTAAALAAAPVATPPLEALEEKDPHQFYIDYASMRINHFWALQEQVMTSPESHEDQRREIKSEAVGETEKEIPTYSKMKKKMIFPLSNLLILSSSS